MVTNNVTFLPKVDKIIVIKDGQISETGTYKELLNGTGAFKNFLLQYLTTQQDIPETIMHDLEEVLDKEEQIKLRRNSAASGKTTGVNMTALYIHILMTLVLDLRVTIRASTVPKKCDFFVPALVPL